MIRFYVLLLAALWLVVPAAAAPSDTTLRASLQGDLNQYLSARSKIEHISAISLSVSLHGQPQNINLTAGRTQYGGGGTPVTPDNLWQIGSNTKAFTAATILQLEAEGKLTIDQTVGRWLPQYPAWKNVTIRRLLNMTSGIPGYNLVPAWLRDYVKNPKRNFTIAQLIAYVYPENNPNAPPPTHGYDYSNTNYLLAELIIERASGHSYASELERRFLQSDIGLNATYYSDAQYSRDVLDRIVSGYSFGHGCRYCAAVRQGRARRYRLMDAGRGRHRLNAGRSDSVGSRALHRADARAQAARRTPQPRFDEDRQADREDEPQRSRRLRTGSGAEHVAGGWDGLVLPGRNGGISHVPRLFPAAGCGDRLRLEQRSRFEGRPGHQTRAHDLQNAARRRSALSHPSTQS